MILYCGGSAGCCDCYIASTNLVQSPDLDISDAGAASLSRALERNTALRTLSFSGEYSKLELEACAFLHFLVQGSL